MSALYLMVSREIEDHAATEAFGWLNSGALVGAAIGTATGGIAVDAYGAPGAIVVATVLAVFATASPLIARATGPLRGLAAEPALATNESPLQLEECSGAS